MSLPSPWSVKGVQPKTREAAKDLARREGLTLGEWLNRLIGDVDEDTAGTSAQSGVQNNETTQSFANASQNAPFPIDPPQNREDTSLANQPNTNRDMVREPETSRLTTALEQLTRRLDAAMSPDGGRPFPQNDATISQPPVNAPASVPFAAAGMIERLEATQRLAETALGRVDASLSDVRQTQTMLAERMRVMEANDPNNKSLLALRGLENALSRLSEQVFDTQTRTQALDETVGVIAQRVVGAEALANETNGRLKEAMVDLSARIAGVEQTQDDANFVAQFKTIDERMGAMEDITTQAIESVDRGLGLVSERVAATEALAQATNERLVEALIDLSARLVQLESIDSKEEARDLLSAIEAKNKELTRRLETLDTKIDTTRSELTQEVKTAIASGVDGRMAEIAKALADRLDMSERRSGEALEKIGAEMARASISLDQRLRELEDRSAVDIAAAMRGEMERMGRAIDERMGAMERRDAQTAQQTDGHIRNLAQTLGERLDVSEARAQNSVQQVSSQMEQLAQRLQARQDETARNLVNRIEEGENRSREDLQTNLNALSGEIRAAEDRAKAVSAPLHRDFNQLVDRLDQVEATGLAPFAETVGFGGEAFDITSIDAFPTAPPLVVEEDPFDLPDNLGTPEPSRRLGFGAPFPDAAFDTQNAPARGGDTSFLSEPSEFDEGPFLGNQPAPKRDEKDHNAFIDDFDTNWEEAGRTPRSNADYLANARLSANRAASERTQAKPKAKKALFGEPKKKVGKAQSSAAMTDASGQTAKAKPVLSPVGMVAAATLVVAAGVMAVNQFTKNNEQDERPNSLNVAPTAQTPNPETSAVLPQAVIPQPTSDLPPPAQDAPASTTNTQAPVSVPVPKVPPARPAASLPAPKPTAQVQQPKAVETARSPQVATRVAAPEPRVAQNVATPIVAPAGQASRPATPRAVPVPFPSSATVPAPKASAPAARAPAPTPAPVQMASANVPRIATPQASRPATPTVAPPTPAARAPAAAPPRAAPPRIASKSEAPVGPVTSANVRQVFNQALAKQQAGDLVGAAAMMRAAAETGDARSLHRLAKMYERGEGVGRDPAQARRLTERAAAGGNSQAMHNMGVYFAEGEGPNRDFAKAAASFRQAASRGVTDSQFNLGAMAEQGLAGQRSDREAYYWYSIAGRSGDRDAVSKARELGARLPAAERAAEDQRVAAFRAQPSNDD